MVVSAMVVTHNWTTEGWLYVAAVLDLSSRRVVGWSMKAERDASLVMDALMMAVWRRGEADALLHHSEQGSQYTSEQFYHLLTDNGIGLVAYLCRSDCSFRLLGVRKPGGFCLLTLNACGAGYRSR